MPAWSIEGGACRRAQRAPVVVAPEMPLREVCQLVSERREDCLVVVDPATQLPLGTLSVHELLCRLGVDGADPGRPVADLMTAGLVTLPADAQLQHAAVTMVRHNVRHLVLVDEAGRFAGLLGQDRLYAAESTELDVLTQRIARTVTLDELPALANAVRRLASRLLDEGLRAEVVCHWVSVLNDLIAVQVIDLLESSFDLPLIPWCWLLFGSEGRLEQTPLSDQDNGLVFVPNDEADTEAARNAFLPFARAVNEALDRCGFPLCRGEIMASNPRWCLSLVEWRSLFMQWTQTPEPEALLNASIFFDLRGLFGAEAPVRRMRQAMLEGVTSSPLCVRLMAQLALDVRPPLGQWFRPFRFDEPRYPNSIDLKKFGSRIFVDAARVLALSAGCAETGTVPRLLAAGELLGWSAHDLAATVEGFYVLQRLRLQYQAGIDRDEGAVAVVDETANRVTPAALHVLDRHLLREALQQAAYLQRRLRNHLRLQ